MQLNANHEEPQIKHDKPMAEALHLSEEDLRPTPEVAQVDCAKCLEYPRFTVAWVYACSGGAIGGGLIGFWVTLLSQNIFMLWLVIVGAIFGIVLGFIPAVVTGLIVAYFKLYRNGKGLFWAGVIGTFVTLSVVLTVTPSLSALIPAVFVGGFSAVLTGLFTLPKACKTSFDNVSKKDHDNY